MVTGRQLFRDTIRFHHAFYKLSEVVSAASAMRGGTLA